MHARFVWSGAGAMLAAGLIACAPALAKSQPPALAEPQPEIQGSDPPLGADVEGMLAAGNRLSPALQAAALDTQAASAVAKGADALDDPTITDSYQYYKDPGVFSAHMVTVSQSFPLGGKRALRRQAALADVEASRGQERAARDELDEKIKVAYAQYYLTSRDLAVNRTLMGLARRVGAAASARYGQGGGEQLALIQAAGEETSLRTEAVRLHGEADAARALLDVLVGRDAETPLAEPMRARKLPAQVPALAVLVDLAEAGNPVLSSDSAQIAAARTRSTLADRAWVPDVTVGAGPLIQTNNRPLGFVATVGLTIPLGWGREASGQHEAAARLGATRRRYDAARLDIEGALGEATARLRAARATESLLRNEAMPQAKAAFQSALANYGQGRSELTAALGGERQVQEVELRLLAVMLDEQVELAAIERLIGGDL